MPAIGHITNEGYGVYTQILQEQLETAGQPVDYVTFNMDEQNIVTGINIYARKKIGDKVQFKTDIDKCIRSINYIDDEQEYTDYIKTTGPVKELGIKEDVPKTLYHITEKANMESILEEGLLPKTGMNTAEVSGAPDYVFLAEEKDIAPWLAVLDELNEPVIFKVDTEGLDIRPGWFRKNREYIPHGFNEFCTTKPIPVSQITEMELTEEFKENLYKAVTAQMEKAKELGEKVQEAARGVERLNTMWEDDFTKAVESLNTQDINMNK